MIGFCLQGYDLIAGKELTSKIINSTHAYEKLDTTLSKDEISLLLDFKDKPIRLFLEQLGIESHLQNILYFAIGYFEESQTQEGSSATTFDFFERVQRYLRSIGYYGDSPMLTAVYGSSEYSQALSRTGSIFGNTFIVNPTVDIKQFAFNENGFESVSFKYNETPLTAQKGLIVSADHHEFMLR